ncbi:MAG: acetate--CoA ligase family protein [Promethearchaeota archaeon]
MKNTTIQGLSQDNPMKKTYESHVLHKILHPKSIAFYGANDDLLNTMGTMQLLNLIDQGFPGKIYPIHPRLNKVLGYKAYKNIADVPTIPDLAFLVLPTRVIPQVLTELGIKGVKHAVMVTAGFREVGDDAGEEKIKKIAKKYGIRFVGPNCIGVFNARYDDSKPDVIFNTTWVQYTGKRGNTSIASQSGTFACHNFLAINEFGFRWNKSISVGNEANIDLCDCLEYFRDDPTTEVICLYIEEIKRGPLFLKLAKQITPKKPIIALYVGGTEGGAKASASHTGSIAGDDDVFNAAFKQAGIRRVYTLQELLATATLFSYFIPQNVIPKGNRLAIITNSGGTGATMSDMATRLGFSIPKFSEKLVTQLKKKLPHTAGLENPIDFTFAMNPENYFDSVPRLVYRSGEVDAIVAYGAFGPDFFSATGNFGKKILNTPEIKKNIKTWNQLVDVVLDRVAKYPKKFNIPIAYVNPMGDKEGLCAKLRARNIPFFRYPDQAVNAMYHYVEYCLYRNKYEN